MAEFRSARSKLIIKKSNQIGFQKAKDGLVRAFRNRQFKFNVEDENSAIAKSMLGTPVIDNVVFGDLEDTAKNVFTDIAGEEGVYEPLQINDVLLEVSQTKNIIKTSIQGRNGTIKEYVSDGDYIITATGRITNNSITENGIYPEEDMFKFRLLLNVPDVIPITSNFLQGFGIFNIVIDDYRIPQERGVNNQQYFEITMSSDTEINLENVEA